MTTQYSTTTGTVGNAVKLNVRLELQTIRTINALVQVCTDSGYSSVVDSLSVTVSPTGRVAIGIFTLTTPPSNFYVRISGGSISTQTQTVTFGASPQTITFIIF